MQTLFWFFSLSFLKVTYYPFILGMHSSVGETLRLVTNFLLSLLAKSSSTCVFDGLNSLIAETHERLKYFSLFKECTPFPDYVHDWTKLQNLFPYHVSNSETTTSSLVFIIFCTISSMSIEIP